MFRKWNFYTEASTKIYKMHHVVSNIIVFLRDRDTIDSRYLFLETTPVTRSTMPLHCLKTDVNRTVRFTSE